MRVIFALLFAIYSFAVDATIEVIKKVENAPLVAVEDGTTSGYAFKESMFKVLVGDLQLSSNFQVSQPEKYVASNFEYDPNFAEYKAQSVDLVLKYKATMVDASTVSVDVKVYDTSSNKLAYQKNYNVNNPDKYPFIAHKMTIDINKYVNATPMDWMNRLILISRYASPKESEIIVADYTLTYQKTIIKGGLNIFPKWANSNQDTIYYTNYLLSKPTLFKLNVYTGQREKVLESDGMLVCSDVSSDGGKLLLTMAPNGQPDIYLYDVYSKQLTKVTDYQGIDVSGSFLEGNSKIAFISDRLGYPNVFSKRIDSPAVEQLVYHGRNNNSCSTYGNYVVYTSRDVGESGGSMFNLYLISTTSDFIRKLTTFGMNQFPKFSDDGESVLFVKNSQGESALGIIRLAYNKTYLFPLKVGKLQSIDW